MENSSLTISLPKAMKKFIEVRLREASFSTPSEYIRSLIPSDQETSSRVELAAFVRGGLRGKPLPKLDEEGWRAVEDLLRQRALETPRKGRVGARQPRGRGATS
jgi:Arc/MetJ-type ribon-helix-helix transcriptional regulator